MRPLPATRHAQLAAKASSYVAHSEPPTDQRRPPIPKPRLAAELARLCPMATGLPAACAGVPGLPLPLMSPASFDAERGVPAKPPLEAEPTVNLDDGAEPAVDGREPGGAYPGKLGAYVGVA